MEVYKFLQKEATDSGYIRAVIRRQSTGEMEANLILGIVF